MRRITVDIAEESVKLEDGATCRLLGGQWVVFYLALALRLLSGKGEPSLFLDAPALRLLRPWFYKKPGSVGKEVARHLHELAEWGLDGMVISGGLTKRWRLNIASQAVVFQPSKEACELWLNEQRVDVGDSIEELPETLVAWLVHVTRALIRLVRGEIEEGLKLVALAKREHGGSALLGATAELIEARLCSRVKSYPDLGPHLTQAQGSLGRALLARADLTTALAPTPEPEDLEEAIRRTREVALRFETLPDIDGLGSAHNALGVLLRRGRHFAEAKRCLRYAAALLVASFDLPNLQAALFNLGHTLSEKAESAEDLREALSLIQLDREIYSELGIGRDSAQAEIVGGTIYLRLNELKEAERWLDAGRRIADTLGSDYDKGGIEELRARLLWAQSWKHHRGIEPDKVREIVAAYERASHHLFSVGDIPKYLEKEVKMVKRGEPPPWLESSWRQLDLDETVS
jgi:tetratricopeptide (TPR) repeat protein